MTKPLKPRRKNGYGLTPTRTFNSDVATRDGLAARNEVKKKIAGIAKEILGDRLTDAEAEAIGDRATTVAVMGLLLNPKVMRHVADARTSHSQSRNKAGKYMGLLPSQQRAVEMSRGGALAKNIPDLLKSEGLASVGKDGSVQMQGMSRAIPEASWESSLSRWKRR